MRKLWVAASIGVAALMWCGCGPDRPLSPPASVPKPSTKSPAETTSAISQPASTTEAADGAAIPDANAQAEANTAAVPAPVGVVAEPVDRKSGSEATTAAQPQPPPHERLAVLTLGGPLIIDAVLTLDGRPHTAPFDDLMRKALAAADTNGDGRSTWTELADNKDYLATAAQPGAPPLGKRQLNALIERFDENRDGQMQPHEAAAWLGRDAGMSVRAFSLRSSRSYRSNPRSNSRVWQLLDADRDAHLSAEEIAAAPPKFWLYDADDDRAIMPAELATLREQLDAAAPAPMTLDRDASRDAAIHLEQSIAVDRLEYLLSDLYSPRQSLGPTSFPGVPGLFEKLDADADGRLDRVELSDLITIEPHVRLTAEFNRAAEPPADRAVLRLTSQSPELKLVTQSTNRIVLDSGPTRLILSAHDLLPGTPSGDGAQPDQIDAMIHDQCDAVFEMLDENSDGRLGEREIALCSQRLMANDTNGDRQLAADELSYAMIIAFFRGERPNEDSFVIPASVAAATTGNGAPPWFVRSDFNGDGDISRREFVGTLEQFRRLDTDGSGFVDAREAAAVSPLPPSAAATQPDIEQKETEIAEK